MFSHQQETNKKKEVISTSGYDCSID